MRTHHRLLSLCLVTAVLVLVAGTAHGALPELGPLPRAAEGIVYAEAVTLDERFPYAWSADRPAVHEGMILVIDADPALVIPRNAAEPVLYVGDYVAWRVAVNAETGRMLVFIPGIVDLATVSVFFGSPDLPERIDRAQARAEAQAAATRGIGTLPASMVRSAERRGGAGRRLAGRLALLQAMQRVAIEYRASDPARQRREP